MEEIIISQFKKAGAIVSDDRCRIEVPLPSDNGKPSGKLTAFFLSGNMLFNLIDIHSALIPDIVANPVQSQNDLKINYCVRGRCELRLKSGECTYLTAGEIAVDAGQAENNFYYPGAEYIGYEVVIRIDTAEKSDPAKSLYYTIEKFDRPVIQKADKHLASFYDSFKYYTEENLGNDLLCLKCQELITYLAKLDLNRTQASRTYYTASQVEIAKKTKDLICSDLSVRHTAKTLAKRFDISETSVKNYFRSVYGCGFSEFQQTVRMEKAAEMLKSTDDKLSDIGLAVGFASQPKFGAAFKTCYGVTPLEYRRMAKLEEENVHE